MWRVGYVKSFDSDIINCNYITTKMIKSEYEFQLFNNCYIFPNNKLMHNRETKILD